MNTLSKGKPLQQPFLGCHPPLPHQHGRQALSLHQHLLDAARCTSFVRFFSSKWRVTTRALRPSQRCQPDGIRLKIGSFLWEITEDGNSQLLQELRFHLTKNTRHPKPLEISVYCPRRPQCGAKSWSPGATKCKVSGMSKEVNKLNKLSTSMPSL